MRDGDGGAQRRPDLEAGARQHAAVRERLVAERRERDRVVGRHRARGQRHQRRVQRDRGRDRRQQRDRAAPDALLGRQLERRARRRLELRGERGQLVAQRPRRPGVRRAGSTAVARAITAAIAGGTAASRRPSRRAAVGAVGMPAGQHVRQQRADGVDVHARIGRRAGARLGRHVAGRAQHHRRARQRSVLGRRVDAGARCRSRTAARGRRRRSARSPA